MSIKIPCRKFSSTTSMQMALLVLWSCLYASNSWAATTEATDKTEPALAATKETTNKTELALAATKETTNKTEPALAATTKATDKANPAETKAALEVSSEQATIPKFPDTLEGAKQAFKQAYYAIALKTLARLEEKHAGQIEFDYLLGRTAIEVKNYDLAIAALTRVLTIDPSFAAARFEIARANYSKGVAKLARGPFEQARTEFKTVLQQKPSEPIEQAIKQYLIYIDKYLEVREAESYLYIELAGGYDSNLNSTSDYPYFSFYNYANSSNETYKLEQNHEKKESAFGKAQVGIGIAWPVFSNNFEIFGGLMVGAKSYSSNHGYDHTWNQVNFGARHYGDTNKKMIQARFKSTDIYNNNNNGGADNNNGTYHEENEMRLQWDQRLNKTNALSLWLLGGDSSYHIQGTYPYSVSYNRHGLEWTHLFEGKRKSSLQVMLMGGRDNPQDCRNNSGPCSESYTRDVSGLRFAWSNNIFTSSRFYTSAFVQYSEYDQEFFYQRRLDRRGEFFMGIDTSLGNYWHLRSELHYTHNHSSIDLYEFERGIASLTLRLEF